MSAMLCLEDGKIHRTGDAFRVRIPFSLIAL